MNSKVTPSTDSTNTEQSAANCWQRLSRFLCYNNSIAPTSQSKELPSVKRRKQPLGKTKRVSHQFSPIESMETKITVPPTQLMRPKHHKPPSAQPNPIRKNGLSSTLETSNKSAFALHRQTPSSSKPALETDINASCITHLRQNN